jgi:hypothetical protein
MSGSPRSQPGRAGSLGGWTARRLAWLLYRPAGRLAAAALILLIVAPLATWGVWRRFGPRLIESADYVLSAEQIELSPPLATAGWIRRDLRAEALRDASLDRPLVITDDDLAARIHQAFSLHPCVARVDRVTKHYPARVVVELTYRRPVAMVVLAADDWWPVDAAGYLLPREDFSPIEAQKYPRIVGVTTAPTRPAGERWGDERVVGGARIAEVLAEDWGRLGLRDIAPAPQGDDASGAEGYLYELTTVRGRRILWGRAEGERPGEATAADKVQRLLSYVREHGSLDAPPDGLDLDLRRGKLDRVPRTAGRP